MWIHYGFPAGAAQYVRLRGKLGSPSRISRLNPKFSLQILVTCTPPGLYRDSRLPNGLDKLRVTFSQIPGQFVVVQRDDQSNRMSVTDYNNLFILPFSQ